jgi:hypothetical protein
MLPGNAVFGCDDTAENEFLNKRKAKGEIAAPQVQSNLWFVKAGVPGDPCSATGYDEKSPELSHSGDNTVTFRLEAGFTGSASPFARPFQGGWRKWRHA